MLLSCGVVFIGSYPRTYTVEQKVRKKKMMGYLTLPLGLSDGFGVPGAGAKF